MVKSLVPNSILSRLKNGEILVFDGATGTYLQNHGLEPGACPELMNDEKPSVVEKMASTYFESGSDIVLTNTFGCNKFRLKHYGLDNQVTKLNEKGASLAKNIAPSNCYVAGSIGPTGEFIQPVGNVSENEMYDVFTEQVIALENGGADAVMIETQMAIEEVKIAIRATRENTNLITMSSMVFDKGPRGFFTMMGITPEVAVNGMLESGAHIIGTNCGNGIEKMLEIATIMRKTTDSLLLVKSNAGIPTIKKEGIIYPETPEFMSEYYSKMLSLPINIIGGCCGTGPDHIKAIRNLVDSTKNK